MTLARAMRSSARAACLAAALLAAGAGAGAQVTFDRTAATVNGELVTKSDLLWNLALDPSTRPSEFWSAEAQALMLRTVVDQRLMLQEAAKLPAAGVEESEVDAMVAEIASKFRAPDDPNRFTERLRLVGLPQDRLREIARDRVRIQKFIDFRFGSFVVVTEDEVLRSYNEAVVPEIRARGAVPPEQPSAEDRVKIRQALTNMKVVAAIDEYFEGARARAEVVVLGE